MDRVFTAFLRILLLLHLVLQGGTGSAEEISAAPIRIGVLAYRGEDQARREWQGHADYLAARIPGRQFVIVPLGYTALEEAVRHHEIELLITNTGHYTELEATGEVSRIATRLIAGPNGPLNQFGGTAIALASRDDLRHYRDLKGQRLLIPDKSSLGGWQVHLREGLNQKIDIEHAVATLVETGNHEKVVLGVLAGDADAGFVRSDLIESMIAGGKLPAGALKVIDARSTPGYPFLHSTRLYPEWPLARVGDFPEEISKSLLIALLAMSPEAPAAKAAHIYGWTLPHNYQPVLDLFREAHLGPYANQKITWNDIMQRQGTTILVAAGSALGFVLFALLMVIRSNRKLHENEASLRLAAGVFSHAQEGILITDPNGIIVDVNDSATRVTGYARDELIGSNPRLLGSGRQGKDFYAALWKTLVATGIWHGELWNRRKDGGHYAQQTSISSIRNREGRTTHYIGLFSDITELKSSQAQLERMAYYDALTGLPNRLLLADRLQQAIAQSNRRGDLLAVCYLDLDNFKPINDRWGHEAGDRLLVEVARRLSLCLRQNDTVSRLGGDEFAILIGELSGFPECELTLERITEALNVPIAIEGQPIPITASIGVTLCPTDGTDPDTLIRHADQAMYAAKQGGRHRYQMFHKQEVISNGKHHAYRFDLERAFAQNEFVLHYQPKVDMRAGTVLGAEALLRWQHPTRGLLYPDAFLFMVDQAGLHPELGEYVLHQALAQMADWASRGMQLAISVNIDARHLQNADFATRLKAILDGQPGVSACDLELEIVETAALRDLAQVSARIAECGKLGVQFAIDDFGTGYSSLSYLKQLPMHTLKIDRSFVHDMLDDPDDLAIVDGVVGLAGAFRRQVIAEGVETVAHGTMLLKLGCDRGQGYGISPPMPAANLPDWVRNWVAPAEWQHAIRWPAADLPLLTVEIDHIRWITQFELILAAEPGSNRPLPPLDPHVCRFGKWLNDEGYRRYHELAEFRQIIPVHEEIHRLGEELFRLHATDPVAARERLPEMHTLRDKLLDNLRRLHAAVLTTTSR